MFGSSRHLVSLWICRAKLGGEWNGKSRRLHPGLSSKQLTFSQNETYSGWWFQILFIFIPYLGNRSILTNICESG